MAKMRSSNFRSSFVLVILLNFANSFEVYWNIPSFMCKKFVNFTNLPLSFGILQNSNDDFRGEKITILYDPGSFPALLTKGSKLYKRNGGVPQEGNLEQHFKEYEKAVDELIPDRNYNGLAVIDFESWRPVFRQNFGSLKLYKDISIKIEKRNHPFWPQPIIENEAARRFDSAGRKFVEDTILLSKKLRPYAKWGYYTFPYCFNNKGENCPSEVQNENNRIKWLFNASDMILPSVYLQESTNAGIRQRMVRGRVKEAMRISRMVSGRPVYVYIRYVYTDSLKLLIESDMLNVFTTAKSQGAAGIILWGASNDLKTDTQCQSFKYYLNNILGPIANSFKKRIFVQSIDNEEREYFDI